MKKSVFFDFLNRHESGDFCSYIDTSTRDKDYINWNEFALPNHYGDAEFEYLCLRNSCAIFDVSPIRKYRIKGQDAGLFLDSLLTRPVSTADKMRGIYVIFCNEDGTLKDDSILYKFSDTDYLLMPSDINHETYFKTLAQQLDLKSLSIVDCTNQWAGIALQGPRSAGVLKTMGCEQVEQLAPFEVRDFPFGAGKLRIARMGFTADLGYECWFTPSLAPSIELAINACRQSMQLDLPGYGLQVLEACRLESGFVVAGWDFATEADPLPGFERFPNEVGLGWLVDTNNTDFVGKQALLTKKQAGHEYLIRSFQIPGTVKPVDGTAIYARVNDTDKEIGSINCSSWSWGLAKMIGNVSVQRDHRLTRDLWIILNDLPVQIYLSRGPLLNLERRNQVPALLA